MARLEFASSIDVKTTPERAFDYFADYRHVPQVLEGVSRWQPIGPRSRGAGARFDVEMVTLGVPLKNVLRLNRWRRPEVLLQPAPRFGNDPRATAGGSKPQGRMAAGEPSAIQLRVPLECASVAPSTPKRRLRR